MYLPKTAIFVQFIYQLTKIGRFYIFASKYVPINVKSLFMDASFDCIILLYKLELYKKRQFCIVHHLTYQKLMILDR